MKLACGSARRISAILQTHAVFGVQMNIVDKWKDAEAWLAGFLFKNGNTIAEECPVTAKSIDEKRPHQRCFTGVQKVESSDY